jgi:uncharacterized protein involved in exopolysaccharide biosynthesis
MTQPGTRAIRRGQSEGGATIGRAYVTPDSPREETSLLGFVNVLLRYRALIIIAAILGGAILGIMEFTKERMFVAYASFTVRGARAPTSASTLATQLGLNIGTSGDEAQSAEFFIDLVRSRSIVARIADSLYTINTPKGPVRRSLASIYGFDKSAGQLAKAEAVEQLRDRITASSWGQTGIILLSVVAEQPALSQQILNNLIAELDAFNIARRKERAAAEREFLEKLLNDAKLDLVRAETQLSTFRELNRAYANSPALGLENSRLQREVGMRQEIVTAMTQSLEQAKIEEVRDTPAITLIDRPEPAAAPATHESIRKTLIGLVAGMMVGIIIAFLRERAVETRQAGTPVYSEFSSLKNETAIGVRRPFGMVSRFFTRQART